MPNALRGVAATAMNSSLKVAMVLDEFITKLTNSASGRFTTTIPAIVTDINLRVLLSCPDCGSNQISMDMTGCADGDTAGATAE